MVQVITPGGGGWGDPFARPGRAGPRGRAAAVREPGGRARDYGVVLDPATFEVDEAATDALALGAAPAPPDDGRGIAEEWLREHGEPLDLGGLAIP